MRNADVAVVGAGPAGVSAALAAAQSGASVILIDENNGIGGQLRWRISMTTEDSGGFEIPPGSGLDIARLLAQQIETSNNITVETGTVAWGLFEDNVLGISNELAADEVQAKSIIVATGSTDIACPFPGWTLPGVMTARAAQIFMHIHRVLPGKTWVILGESGEADELATDLERVGVEIVTRCTDVEQIRASGTNRLAHVEIGEDTYEADSLAIALGRQPDPELAFHAKVDGAFVRELGGYTVYRDEYGQTTEEGVYVAGDAAGIATMPELVAEGRLVGLAAAGASAAELSAAREVFASVSTEGRNRAITQLRLAPTST
jgi:sarcosine oxidase, subunit alpha